MQHHWSHISLIALLVVLGACSSESNSVTSKIYHNLTAHYNGYYYARDEIVQIELAISAAYTDDYNNILRIFPAFDTTVAKGYDEHVQEAVKMASLSIQRHPESKWVDDAYILVGKARLYSLDWGNAVQTFKYVNTKSKDRDARHRALLWLIRTFCENKEFANALAAIQYLEKEKLSKQIRKDLYIEKAYYYQLHEDYDNMVRNLILTDPLMSKRDRPGRIYFIIGQVYQQLGFESEAFNYYRKCLGTNPEYEVDFYARLYMAQVTEISRSRDINSARKSFRKLLKDTKNREFRDKIFYEMALFELKQSNIEEAIENLNNSLRAGTSTLVRGEAYLRLAEIYYENEHKYERSQAYYDSALISLPPDYKDYTSIKERQQILTDFVTALHTIQWQDSLLVLADMDSARIYTLVQGDVKRRNPPPSKKKKRKTNLIEIGAVNNSMGESQLLAGTSEWYFGNPTAVASGRVEFQRTWGKIPLADNWRRSIKAGTFNEPALNTRTPGQQEPNQQAGEAVVSTSADPVQAEYERLVEQIPKNEEQRTAALQQIESAYFKLGDIYFFQLDEKENASETYLKLLERFPNTEFAAEVLYKLYLLNKDSQPGLANEYAEHVKRDYPNTSFARVLENPNYLNESSITAEKQKIEYGKAYQSFITGDFKAAHNLIASATSLGDSYFVPNLELLDILVIGETEDITQYQYSLEQFIKRYPDADITSYANRLLQSSRDLQLRREKERGIQYIASFDEPHYFVISYPQTSNISRQITAVLERFNHSFSTTGAINTSSIIFSDELAFMMASEFSRQDALAYLQGINQQLAGEAGLGNQKFDTFVITKDNFDILYRTKGLEEYVRFFRRSYLVESP